MFYADVVYYISAESIAFFGSIPHITNSQTCLKQINNKKKPQNQSYEAAKIKYGEMWNQTF